MRKNYDLRKIVVKRSYSAVELAETLGVHVQTIRDWHRAGMSPLVGTKSPYLFLGSEVKAFLHRERDKHSVKLGDGEFYCLPCRKAVKPDSESIEIKEREQRLGNGAKSVYLVGKCPECGTGLRRFSSARLIAQQKTARTPPKPTPKIESSKQEEQRTFFD